MNKINDIEFEQLLSKAVKDSFQKEMDSVPDIDFVPSEEFKNKMAKLFKQYDRVEKIKKLKFYSKRVAMILIIVFGLIASIINMDAMAGIRGVIVEWFEDHTTFNFEPTDEEMDREEFELNRIPEEYKIENYEDLGDLKIMYLVKDATKIWFSYVTTDVNQSLGVDNEYRDFKDIYINGYEGILFEGHTIENGNTILWEMEGYRFEISGMVEVAELIDIIEKIIENKF